MTKNKAAVALGKRRWFGISPEDRSTQMRELARRAAKKMTKRQRIARAKLASAAAAVARKRKFLEKTASSKA